MQSNRVINQQLTKLNEIRIDIGKKIDNAISKDNVTDMISLEPRYESISLQISKLQKTLSKSMPQTQQRKIKSWR